MGPSSYGMSTTADKHVGRAQFGQRSRPWRWPRLAWCSATSARVPCTPCRHASPAPNIQVTPEHFFGVLSLIFWALVLVILLKYVVVVLNADNKGEGGVLALTALVVNTERASPRRRLYGMLGILGAALVLLGRRDHAGDIGAERRGRPACRRAGCADSDPADHARGFGRAVPDPETRHGVGRQSVRPGDARLVRDTCGHGR